MKYQLLYIIKSNLDDGAKNEVIEKVNANIASLNGVVDSVDKWGDKKFAYVIDGMKEGYYVLVKFTADPTVPAELDRQMRINASIVRQMITKQVASVEVPVEKAAEVPAEASEEKAE